MPSYHEGMANTLLECAAMGRPLITSNIHGCKEAVIDGKNGYLVEVKNQKDLYEKLSLFININFESKKNMCVESRKHIVENFDKYKVVNATISAMMSL